MDTSNHAVQLEVARALVIALENNDAQQAEELLLTLTQFQESDLFQEVGKLTRELHDSLNNFDVDSRLVDLAENEMSDTRDRLNFVIKTTEAATHKTLGFIDQTFPLTSELKQTSEKISESWHRFRIKEMDADEFQSLENEIDAYLPKIKQHSEKIHANLSEIILAQGFQDITGQVISQVIDLVGEVERNLVQLVKVAGKHIDSTKKDNKKVDPIKAEGPQINAEDNPDVLNNQDEVDDLLSSLGF